MRDVQLPDVDNVRITCDGEEFTAWRKTGPDAELDLTTGDHALVVHTGYHGRGVEGTQEPGHTTRAVVTGPGATATNGSLAAPSAAAIAAVASSCRCC